MAILFTHSSPPRSFVSFRYVCNINMFRGTHNLQNLLFTKMLKMIWNSQAFKASTFFCGFSLFASQFEKLLLLKAKILICSKFGETLLGDRMLKNVKERFSFWYAYKVVVSMSFWKLRSWQKNLKEKVPFFTNKNECLLNEELCNVIAEKTIN